MCHFFYGLRHSISWRLYILFNLQDVVLEIFWDAGLKKVAKCTSLTTLSTTGKLKKFTNLYFNHMKHCTCIYQTDSLLFFFSFEREHYQFGQWRLQHVKQRNRGSSKNVLHELHNADVNFSNIDNSIAAQNNIKEKLVPSLIEQFDKWYAECQKSLKLLLLGTDS